MYNNNNRTNQTLVRTNQSSRSFVNNRTPKSWTFAMISHNNSNNNVNLFNGNGNAISRRYSSNMNNTFNSRGHLNRNNFISKNKLTNSTNSSSNPQTTVLSTNLTNRHLENNSNHKQLVSTRRPFLSRSINYKPLTSAISIKNNDQILDSNRTSNEFQSNRPLIESNGQRKPFISRSTIVSSSATGSKPKTTLIAISSDNLIEHPFNFNPFGELNPVQFMQNVFDQIFSSKFNGNFFSLINN